MPGVTPVPRRDPDNVVLCLLAAEEEEAGDAALQIHFTLLRAFCCENDINILRVSNPARLAQLLLPAAGPDPPADLHCVLVTVSPDDTAGTRRGHPRRQPGCSEPPRPGLEPAAAARPPRRSRGAPGLSPPPALFPSFSFVFPPLSPVVLVFLSFVFLLFPPFIISPAPSPYFPPLPCIFFPFPPLFSFPPPPRRLLSLPLFFPPVPSSAPESKANLLTCSQA